DYDLTEGKIYRVVEFDEDDTPVIKEDDGCDHYLMEDGGCIGWAHYRLKAGDRIRVTDVSTWKGGDGGIKEGDEFTLRGDAGGYLYFQYGGKIHFIAYSGMPVGNCVTFEVIEEASTDGEAEEKTEKVDLSLIHVGDFVYPTLATAES